MFSWDITHYICNEMRNWIYVLFIGTHIFSKLSMFLLFEKFLQNLRLKYCIMNEWMIFIFIINFYYVYMWKHILGYIRFLGEHYDYLTPLFIILFLLQCPSLNLKLTDLTWMASQQVPLIRLLLPSQG